MFRVLLMNLLLTMLFFALLLFNLFVGLTDMLIGNPLIITTIQRFVVDIVFVAGFVLLLCNNEI
jgi:hypothetical protein